MTPSLRCGALSCALVLGGCSLQVGVHPPQGRLNCPIALALSHSIDGAPPRYLYVANSNFDLRYNQATLMAIDLDAVNGRLRNCVPEDDCQIEDLLSESPSGTFPPVLHDEVAIGSHADGIALSPGGSRIY